MRIASHMKFRQIRSLPHQNRFIGFFSFLVVNNSETSSSEVKKQKRDSSFSQIKTSNRNIFHFFHVSSVYFPSTLNYLLIISRKFTEMNNNSLLIVIEHIQTNGGSYLN